MIAIVVTVIAFIMLGVDFEEEEWNFRPRCFAALLCLLIVLFGIVKSVPTGYTGILTTFGRVEDNTLDAGLHIIKPTQKVVLIDNRERKHLFEVEAFSSDIQQVNVEGSVNYMVDKETAMVLYREVGIGYNDVLIKPRVLENVKAVFSQYTAENLVASRDMLSENAMERLKADLEKYGIIVMSVSIENIDFTDVFTNAVEAKQVAAQEKLTAQTKQEQAIMEADAAAEILRIQTTANADRKMIEADAEAYAMRSKADAQAFANFAIGESITEELIEYEYATGWDGELPSTMLGSDVVPVIGVADDEE